VCAGYLRVLDETFVERFRGRVLNIHPSLLPAYRGLKTHARAIADGAAEHGASVHFVSPELDAGAVIAQARVPVLPGDTPDALAERVLAAEHPLLVKVLGLAVAGRIAEQGDTALLDGHPLLAPLPLDSAELDCLAFRPGEIARLSPAACRAGRGRRGVPGGRAAAPAPATTRSRGGTSCPGVVPFNARYAVFRDGKPLGDATLELVALDHARWRIDLRIEATHGLMSLANLDLQQSTVFDETPGGFRPLSQATVRKALFSRKQITGTYDWSRQSRAVDRRCEEDPPRAGSRCRPGT
jgi:hypothetical protein